MQTDVLRYSMFWYNTMSYNTTWHTMMSNRKPKQIWLNKHIAVQKNDKKNDIKVLYMYNIVL